MQPKPISIHLMLWFNRNFHFTKVSLINISIHLMLWFNGILVYTYSPSNVNFNTSYVVVQRLSTFVVSVFYNYFNTSYVVVQHLQIICSCQSVNHFNTSYVVVQPYSPPSPCKIKAFQYILCCGSTSATLWKRSLETIFQYILCCGSTVFFQRMLQTVANFNTSYVVVQPPT